LQLSSNVNKNTFCKLKMFWGLKMHCQNIVDGRYVQKEFFCKFFKIKFTSQILLTDIFWILSSRFPCDYSFWIKDLNFGLCIKDSINKTCWFHDGIKIC
jgi:hypothetical protein